MTTVSVRKARRYVPDLRRFGALCDGNYHRLYRLRMSRSQGIAAPAIEELELHRGDHYLGRIRIRLLQSTRYTETLLLEQVHNSGRWLNNPCLTVRIYHDASMAEVISCYRNHRIEAVNDYPNRYMHHPDEKVQVNSFLADWLDYCLRFGHAPLGRSFWTAGGADQG